jgi:hypothetical protein
MSVKRLLAQLINKNGTPVEVSDGNRLLVESAGVGGGALATEGTLISVLNAIIASDQDIEILLVRDTGNSDEVVQQITNYETGTPVVSYKDVNGAVYVPVGPLEYLDPSAVLNLMLTEMLDQGLVLDAIKIDTANLDVGLSTRATEATLLLVKNVLDTLKTDTALMVTDLAAIEVLLAAIDTVLDTIKVDTGTIATDTAAMVVDLAAIEVLLTTMDTVLDNIKLDTAQLALGTTGDTTSVASSITVVTLKASNTSRKSLKIVNDGTKILYVREGSGATTSLYTWKLEQDEMAIINDYNGIVTGIWDVANGSAKVTETT